MKKLIIGLGLFIGSIFAAYGVGQIPTPGFRLIDGTYILGLAGGVNNIYDNGLIGAGTNQATSTALPANTALIEFDTVASSTGFQLPFALPGTVIDMYNNGAQTATIYPNVTNNPVSNAQDTINNGVSTTVASHVQLHCMSAKAGVWGCQ
jgi:hypothetical protein